MSIFIGLLKRELQEHPALYIGPLGVNLFVAVSAILLVARGIGSPENLRDIVEMLNLADERTLEFGRSALIASPMALVILLTIVIGFFYFIDCLYAERKERTILFFKSFPVSDTETVLSKLFCGLVLLPAISLAAYALTQLFVLTIVSVALAAAGGSPGALWSVGTMFSNWLFTFYVLLTCAFWYAPFIAFLVLASAWAKRAVFLWALLPLFIIWAEFFLPGRNFVGPIIVGHIRGYMAAAFSFGETTIAVNDEQIPEFLRGGALDPLALTDPAGFLAQPALWFGCVIAVLFIASAIRLRRYRDDS